MRGCFVCLWPAEFHCYTHEHVLLMRTGRQECAITTATTRRTPESPIKDIKGMEQTDKGIAGNQTLTIAAKEDQNAKSQMYHDDL